jgi:hypothetical protein
MGSISLGSRAFSAQPVWGDHWVIGPRASNSASALRPGPQPDTLRLEPRVRRRVLQYVDPFRAQGGQAHKEEPCVEGASSYPLRERLGLNLYPVHVEQLCKLPGVHCPLSNRVPENVTSKPLPWVGFSQPNRLFSLFFRRLAHFFKALIFLDFIQEHRLESYLQRRQKCPLCFFRRFTADDGACAQATTGSDHQKPSNEGERRGT